jgi:chromate transporter
MRKVNCRRIPILSMIDPVLPPRTREPASQEPPPSLAELFMGMLQVAMMAFGGGLSAWSQRIVVEQRRWMTDEEYLTGLSVARLLPGPNQINTAVYIGVFFRGLPGAIAALAGMLLVPFSLLMLVGVIYFQIHMVPSVDRVLAGVVAAAAGMALSMGFKILDDYWSDPVALLLAAGSFIAMTFFHVSIIPLVLIAGPIAMIWYWPRRRPTDL